MCAFVLPLEIGAFFYRYEHGVHIRDRYICICLHYIHMTQVRIDADLNNDLQLLKRIIGKKNMTETIRHALNAAGFNEAFFEKMVELQDREKVGTE